MPNYRRAHVAGGKFFFTVVTYRRQPIFADTNAVDTLREVIALTSDRWPFTIDAAVILPDHLHMIWTLPKDDANFSTRWSVIKARFTQRWKHNAAGARTPRQQRQRLGRVWQPRFMEHTIRDEADFERHVDYIHYNPVKHGLVQHPVDWPHSSIHSYIARGILDAQWGTTGKPATPKWMERM